MNIMCVRRIMHMCIHIYHNLSFLLEGALGVRSIVVSGHVEVEVCRLYIQPSGFYFGILY